MLKKLNARINSAVKSRNRLKVVLILLLTIIAVEILSSILFPVLTDIKLSFENESRLRAERLSEISSLTEPVRDNRAFYEFHPYVGFAGVPGKFPSGKDGNAFNDFGVLVSGEKKYPNTKESDEFVIGVFGGSVAEMFTNQAEKEFGEFLNRELGTTKKVVLINLATGGYKQPQQLFQLQYALLSGFQFDLILNIDGFNDLVLAHHNYRIGVNPVFPSGFHMALMGQLGETQLPQKEIVELMAIYYEMISNEKALLSFVDRLPFRYSPFFNLLGQVWINRNKKQSDWIMYSLTTAAQKKMSNTFKGPAYVPKYNDEFGDAVNIWYESSKMMNAIAKANGLPYVHILQPNQYVENSKTLTKEEKEVAINMANAWGVSAKRGYRYLVEKGNQIKKDGISFYDLTMVFKNIKDPLYIDNCCHFSIEGNIIFARRIAQVIATSYQKKASK